jgi:hypothetical protein
MCQKDNTTTDITIDITTDNWFYINYVLSSTAKVKGAFYRGTICLSYKSLLDITDNNYVTLPSSTFVKNDKFLYYAYIKSGGSEITAGSSSNSLSRSYSNSHTFTQLFVVSTSDFNSGKNTLNLIASAPSINNAMFSVPPTSTKCLLFLTGQITMVRIA